MAAAPTLGVAGIPSEGSTATLGTDMIGLQISSALMAALITAGHILTVAPVAAAEPPGAPQPPAMRALRVIQLDLSGTHSHAAHSSAPHAGNASPWRTSFGSERRSAPRPAAAPDDLDETDIVILQGVLNLKSIRPWLPARAWRIIVSQQAVSRAVNRPSRDRSTTPTGPGEGSGFTAIAVRYDRAIRLAGRDPLTALQTSDETGGAPADATAVRIVTGQTPVWVLSVMLPDTCLAVAENCDQARALASWRAARQAEGAMIVTGGRIGSSGVPGHTDDPCSGHGIMVNATNGSTLQKHAIFKLNGECEAREIFQN